MDAERKGRLWTLFRVFFKISAVSVGGGLTMLPLMSREFSEERKWITEEEMPGVFAASVGVVLPPVIVILAIAALLFQLSGNETMDHIFLGVRAAVSALILLSVIKMSRSVLKGPLPIAIALIGFLLLVLFDVDAVGMIVGAAVVGLAMGAIQSLRRNRAAGGAAK